MNVLIISPGYPADMPEFTRGLAECGARVFGVGDQRRRRCRSWCAGRCANTCRYRRCGTAAVSSPSCSERLRGHELDRIECLWEPGIMLAAELREHFGVAGPGRRTGAAVSRQGGDETGAG